MRSVRNFSSEWGYLAPAPSFARTARVVLVATAIGATAGAGVVLSLIDRSPIPQRTSVAARAIVTGVREAAAPAAPQITAAPIAPVTAQVTAPAASLASPPASSPVAPSEVATQSSNLAPVSPGQPAGQSAAVPSTEASVSAQTPAQTRSPVTPAENTALASETGPTETSVRETGVTIHCFGGCFNRRSKLCRSIRARHCSKPNREIATIAKWAGGLRRLMKVRRYLTQACLNAHLPIDALLDDEGIEWIKSLKMPGKTC
jgi:hypothetical protein